MKRLNRKGFTLVELLAVIVILAIVVGITMATILPTLNSARSESFGVAMDTIEKYIQDQVELYTLGPAAQGSNYVSAVGAANCYDAAKPCTNEVGGVDILELTEYSSNISNFQWYIDSKGDVKITCATVNPDGDYKQGTTTETTACPAKQQ